MTERRAHNGKHAETGQLDQKRHLLDPGLTGRESSQLYLNSSYQFLQRMQQGEILLHT